MIQKPKPGALLLTDFFGPERRLADFLLASYRASQAAMRGRVWYIFMQVKQGETSYEMQVGTLATPGATAGR